MKRGRSHRTVTGEILRLLLVLLILSAAQAHGEVYQWKDARGVDHYTNRKDDIPVRYRSDAKAMEYDQEPKAAGRPASGKEVEHDIRPEQVIPQVEKQRDRTRGRRQRPVRDRE